MGSQSVSAKGVADRQMRAFFLDAVKTAVSNQAVRAEPSTVDYVAELLTFYARSRNFFETTHEGIGLRPLAEYYGQAVQGPTAQERVQALRRLGDVALFVSGLLADSLNRKLVDVDYYIAMGGSAYGHLADRPVASWRAGGVEVSPEVFGELAEKFAAFVEVLAEVGEQSLTRDNSSLLRTYEVWVRTRSARAARRLQRQGILPASGSVSRRQH